MGVFSVTAEAADYEVGTTVLAALAAFFAWTTLYFLLCLINSKRSYEWNCRIVATLHAVTVVLLSAWCGFVQGPWPFTDAGAPNTRLQHWTVVICLGYFTWDLIWCLCIGTEGTVMLLHHCLSLFGQFYVLYLGSDGVEMIATLFGSELSNPFLQMRWFLRASDHHKTWYGEVNDHLFMFLFGFLRIGVGTYLLYTTFSSSRPDGIIKLGALAMYAISWVFWIMILGYAVRKYRKMFKESSGDRKVSEEKPDSTAGGDTELRKRRVHAEEGRCKTGETSAGLTGTLVNGEAGLKEEEGAGLRYREAGLRNGEALHKDAGAGLRNGEAELIDRKVGLKNWEAGLSNGNIGIKSDSCDVDVIMANGHVKKE